MGWEKVAKPKKYGGLCVREARVANISLLGKLVWDLQHCPLKLWVHIIKNSNIGPEGVLNGNTTQGSNTWHVIAKAKQYLKAGYYFRVGNGEVSF